MSKQPPFSDYHRRALAWLATDIERARIERLTADVVLKAKCPLCPPLIDREGGAHIDTHAQVQNSEQPSSPVRTWLAEDSNAMAAMLPPSWWQRMKTKLRLFIDGWIDPTVRS